MIDYKNFLVYNKNKFKAGKATLQKHEINELINETYQLITESINEFYKNSDYEIISEISSLFDSILEGEFEKEFMLNYDTEVFFSLGQNLLKILNQNSQNNKEQIFNLTYQYLNFFRYSEILKRLSDINKWTLLISELIEISKYNTRKLFEFRVKQYSNKIAFKILEGDSVKNYSWNDIDLMVKKYSKSLLNLINETSNEPKIAFLMNNCLEMALLDIACLNSGIINVMIPANSVTQHISFILNQTQVDYILLDDEKQLSKLKSIKNELKFLKKGVLIHGFSSEEWIISFSDFLKLEKLNANIQPNELDYNSLATLMYTSGTTGEPKGIIFTQKNIIFKRFCRAIALPEIGEEDHFLAYLPLFHTFGRWFELIGTIFWGATYTFMENPSAETMIANMKLIKPTIFISIPKKWIQLYEYISSRVDIERDDEEKILKEVKVTTGEHLKWGLSAAGFLPPEIFQFFQKYKIELMSGFGMTEATGGITMTPPYQYKINSLGKALPGIQIKLAKDGELLIKGDYVMLGYFDQSEEETFIEDGWFPTGDIMKMDNSGFIEIIDRKKEIYKNIKGETIAPQKIENLFRDFDVIKQVFVVGDHKPFNTVLIFPDKENVKFNQLKDEQKSEYFSNLIVTINKFLAPFERIVDFRMIDRPFSDEHGELTPKGTYKRRIIEKNFVDIIKNLYKKDYYSLIIDNAEVKIPNWFLREKGCLKGDIIYSNHEILIPKLEKKLTLYSVSKNIFRIGDYSFQINKPAIDFQEFLINPIYWLGNEGLFSFTDESILQWYRQNTEEDSIKFIERYFETTDFNLAEWEINKIKSAGEKSLYGIHTALILLQSKIFEKAKMGLDYITILLEDRTQELYKIALYFLYRPFIVQNLEIQKIMFLLLLQNEKQSEVKKILEIYTKIGPQIIDEDIINQLVSLKNITQSVEEIYGIVNEKIQMYVGQENLEETIIPPLLDILAIVGIKHPTKYEDLRRKLVKLQLIKDWDIMSKIARMYRTKMRKGFRKWFGANEIVSVDSETGEEYGWDDVIVFEEELSEKEKKMLSNIIFKTPIIREAVFLFSKGVLIRLSSILPRGIWISKYTENEMTVAYRTSIQTRHQGSFDIVLYKNKGRNKNEVLEEVNWLILAGNRFFVTELVEDFGGYWEDYDIWTQKYLPGTTVASLFNRELKSDENFIKEKFYHLWPFFIWNAAAAYVNFWKLTSGKIQLNNPTAENLVIPSHDYQLGARFVSLSDRSPFVSHIDFLFNFYNKFVEPIELKYSFVKRTSSWKYVFPGFLSALGEQDGVETLKYFLYEISESEKNEANLIKSQLEKFLKSIEDTGFIPKQLYFAIKRFLRWYKLNADASINAQAQMLNELFDTYNLSDLEKYFPETRTRFYLKTIFKDSDSQITNFLMEICQKQHKNSMKKEEFLKKLSTFQNEFELTEKEKYFIARLSYPHLKPTDSATVLNFEVEGNLLANLVVQVQDQEGNYFHIRKPITPKEISKLYQLYLESNLQVNFKPEHHFLIAKSERGSIIGGLFYTYFENGVVHMDKIVVAERYRRNGVSEAIMNEFFNRIKDEGYKFITTGFFRPEYFYRFGFKIEKKYSGLVKEL